MIVPIHLHTSIQIQTPAGPLAHVELALPDGARISDALAALGIILEPEHLLLVVNRRICEADTMLLPGDELDIIPAMSGGAA